MRPLSYRIEPSLLRAGSLALIVVGLLLGSPFVLTGVPRTVAAAAATPEGHLVASTVSSVGVHVPPPPGAPRPASIIDPTRYRTSEPAPMGIADFGVSGSGSSAVGYSYATSSLQGTAVVRSMSVTISGSSSKVMAFELNAVIVLGRGGTNFTYWIQNGLHVDASSHQFSIGGAYVWNFSAPGASISAGELAGNASSFLSSGAYIFIPSCAAKFSGQCTTVALPETLVGRVVSAVANGTPFVAYQYDLGAGWVTYDNVSFPRMAGATDPGFRVNGFYATPLAANAYYDAEWVWVGAGGGSAATDQGSDLDLSLSYWNGHNYQAVPSAWDFGSNTGESSTNITESLAGPDPTDPGAHLVSGSGTLGPLYTTADVGFLNVTIPASGLQTLFVDGSYVFVNGGWANLTLRTGSHVVELESYSNSTVNVTIVAAATTFLDLSGAGRVTISETGLPAGTSWGIVLDGVMQSTSATSLDLHLPNGNYSLSYLGVPGYYRTNAPNPGSIELPGTTSILLTFGVYTYPVSFTEAGLPASVTWWVASGAQRVNGTVGTLDLALPNGSSDFTVGAPYEFVAAPATGTVHVVGGLVAPQEITFSYRPTFIDGFVSPTNASVSVGGVAVPLVNGLYNDSVVPGEYHLLVVAPGQVSQAFDVVATPGNVTWANVTLLANTTGNGNGSTPPVASSSSGVSPTELVAVVGIAVVIAIAVVVVAARRRT